MFSTDGNQSRYDDRGALLMEYAAVFAFVILVAIVALTAFGVSVTDLYTDNMEQFGRAIDRNIR